MSRRMSLLTIRANTEERQLVATVARRLGLTEADMVRQVVAEKAAQLGINAANDKRQPCQAGVSA